MIEFLRFFILTYTGFVRLAAYDPQVLVLLAYTYLIELFAWSLPLLATIISNDHTIKQTSGASFTSDRYIYELNIAGTCMLVIVTLTELYFLHRLQAEAARVDWQRFGEQIIPLYQGGVYKRLFMAE